MFGLKKKTTEEKKQEAPLQETPAQKVPAADAEAPVLSEKRPAEVAEKGTEAPQKEEGLRVSAAEMAEFEEFKRQKKILELRRMLKTIDHTLLKQTATREDVRRLCKEAVDYGFYSVCVQPVYVSACTDFLKNAPQIKIACVVGFPMGENKTETKVFETKRAVADGADEIDMVICISAVKNANYAYVKKEIRQIVKAAKGAPVKVIIETSLLTRDEMVKAAQCAKDAGAAFVKTSTGYFGEGAKAEDVRLLKETVKGSCFVKASGGIRSAEQFRTMLEAGADRIGTSAGVEIADSLKKQL